MLTVTFGYVQVLLTSEAEIEAILQVPDAPNLTQLDNTLRMFITFCAAYHGESPCCSITNADICQTTTFQIKPNFNRPYRRYSSPSSSRIIMSAWSGSYSPMHKKSVLLSASSTDPM